MSPCGPVLSVQPAGRGHIFWENAMGTTPEYRLELARMLAEHDQEVEKAWAWLQDARHMVLLCKILNRSTPETFKAHMDNDAIRQIVWDFASIGFYAVFLQKEHPDEFKQRLVGPDEVPPGTEP